MSQLLPGEFELNILQHLLTGEDIPGLIWGAAMSVAIEELQGGGYVYPRRKLGGISYEITDKGRAILLLKRGV
jgi:hypothetical protein